MRLLMQARKHMLRSRAGRGASMHACMPMGGHACYSFRMREWPVQAWGLAVSVFVIHVPPHAPPPHTLAHLSGKLQEELQGDRTLAEL